MTIQLSPPQKIRNYFDAGFHGILAVLEALGPTGPNIPNVLANLKSGFGALEGANEDEASHRAWVWAFKTLSYAASDVLKAERRKAPLSPQKDDAVREFLEAATQFGGQELDPLALMNPGMSPLFASAEQALGPMILKATTGTDLGLTNLKNRFKQALRTGSNRTLCEDPVYFRVLEDGLTGLAGEGARRDTQWARHSHWVSHYFTDAPIFSPDEDEIIPLEAVYLPLRCFWHQAEKAVAEDGTEGLKKTAHVADLHSSAHSWLSKDARRDPLLIITGGPGSGKSSFARAFAHEVILDGAHRVLLIQLQHMTLTGALREDIARYVHHRDTMIGKNGNPGLPGNPLDWLKMDDRPLLMVFDGLDELSAKEEDGERYARDLLLSLKLMLSPLNTDGTPVRALVMGRNLACEAAMKVANIPLEHMLNVAPIAKMTHETCMMPSNNNDIHDPEGLMVEDQRQAYWRKWAILKEKNPDEIPEAIIAESMEELNVEPLLLHLLMISKYSGDEWEVAADNKNVVYEDILQKIFDRNKNKDHFRAAGVTEQLFFELMECLGIAAWRGNGRTGGEDDFRLIRKLHLNREKKFKDFPAASLESVALNIHTRAGQNDASGGFEFIHKSFGEYLAARGLLSHALKTAITLQEKEPEDVEQPWSQIIGSAELTTEIIDFLYDEARWKLSPGNALEQKDALTELINWSLAHGFSVHKVAPELSWTEIATRQRCAASALIASTSAFATAIPVGDWEAVEFDAPWTVNVEWPESHRFNVKKLLNDIGVLIETPVIAALRRINLSDQVLWDTSFNRTNFEGADLRNVSIMWGLLIGSNFERANLHLAEFSYSRPIDVSLRGCNLSKAVFNKARFDSVDMRSCNLRDASFREADASKNYLGSGLNNYTGQVVGGTIDFDGADLTNADLSDANLSGVINLSIESVNMAVGTIGTTLPDYIDREKVIWLQGGNAKEVIPHQYSKMLLRDERVARKTG